jgi:hypothetical protein
MRMRFVSLALLLFLAACTFQPSRVQPSKPAAPAAAAPAGASGRNLPTEQDRFFNGSSNCVICHTNMVDEAGKDVSIDKMWRATMLANAAHDPYWLATVRSEVNHAPDLSDTIQKKCAACHMPMAEFTASASKDAARILDDGFNAANHPLHTLALDGVSCTLCHQIEPGNFGQRESFSGGFQVDADKPKGERPAYGPYPIAPNLTTVMKSASGFIPQEGKHMAKAEACGTCHNLYTPYLDDQGKVAGEFPEQMIYSEWANSSYRSGDCQVCHMPQAQGGVKIATTGGQKRSPFFEHIFVGGNAFMGKIFSQNTEALQLTASPAQFETISGLAQQQIEQQTASLTLDGVKLQGSRLTGQVQLVSKVGHKFPAGFPSRRAWLHVTVFDKAGKPVFESGAVRPDGLIAGNDNDADASRFEPHYTTLAAPDQVQIYEAIMADVNGKVTTNLLRGASYAKDNRVLPVGFDLKAANPDIQVRGVEKDADFAPGGDRLNLDLDLDAGQAPFTLKVELLYQSIGYRWAANLIAQNTAESETFAGLYEKTPNLPLVAAAVETAVNP